MSATVQLIFGEDEYLVSSKAKKTVESLLPPDERTLGLEVIDGAADSVDAAVELLGRCREALLTPGFLATRKVVWLRDATFLAETPLGRSETVKSRLDELSAMIREGLPPNQVFLITARRVGKRLAFYKACKECGEISEYAVPDKEYLAERRAGEYLVRILKRSGLRMDGDVRQAFLETVGTDTRQMVGEVEKLAVFLGEREDAGLEDIRAVTSATRASLAWDLADAFGCRELSRALMLVRRLLAQKESPVGLAIGLQNRIRDLMVYRTALDRGWVKQGGRSRGAMEWGAVPRETERVFTESMARDPRATHPYRVGVLARQARRFSAAELRRCLTEAVEAHLRLVSRSVPEGIVLELLLIRMLSGGRGPGTSKV
jgi:DNA polymerase-3 subunit delta